MGRGWKEDQEIHQKKQQARKDKPQQAKGGVGSSGGSGHIPDDREKVIRKEVQQAHAHQGKSFKQNSPKRHIDKSKKH